MANQPVPQYTRKPYKQLDGGLATRADALQIPASQFTQLDNAIGADHDVLEKAPGYTLDGAPFPNSTDSFIRMLANFRVGTSVNSLVVAAQDNGNTNATYKVDLKQSFGDGTYNYIGYTTGTSLFTSGSTAVVGTGTAYNLHLKAGDKIGTGAHPSVWYTVSSITDATHLTLSATYAESTTTSVAYMARIILSLSAIPVSLVFNNKIIISNGSEKMMEFDNTSMLLMQDTHAPLAKLLEKHKNRVFSGNTPAGPSALAWSKVNDETVWDAASIASVFPQDNGQLVAIKSFGDSLLCFKDNGIVYRVTGDFDQDSIGAPASIKKMDCPDNLGIIAGKSIAINDDNNLYFSCETGLYTIDPYWFQIKKISWDVSPTLANLIFKSTATSSKQFVYSTQAQWNTGTHNGTVANTGNQLTTYLNQTTMIHGNLYARPDPSLGTQQGTGPGTAAIAIDSNNTVHVVFVQYSLSGGQTYTYAQYATDGTVTYENTWNAPASGGVTAYAIAVAGDGRIGVTYTVNSDPNGGADNTITQSYTERISSGTATFTNGSNSVSGLGTAWSTQLTAGSLIKNSVDGTFATVSTVNSDTSITLTANYAGTSGTGISYSAWNNPVTVGIPFGPVGLRWGAASIKFTSGNVARILWVNNGKALIFKQDSVGSGTFTSVTIASGLADSQFYRSSLIVSGSNLYASFTLDNSTIRCWTSSNDGATWSNLENFSVTMTVDDGIQVAIDGGGNVITGYGDGAIKKRNHSTASSTTLDSTANSKFNGYIFYNGNDYAMNIPGAAGSQVEKYIYLGSSTVQSSSTNVIISRGPLSSTGGYIGGAIISDSMVNNGGVFATLAFGTQGSGYGKLVVRRISFQGIWTSPKQSDSTLSVWGTYAVSGETDNGATVLQQIALGSTSTLGAPVTITNGNIVSADSTKIFYQVTVTMTIASMSAPVIGSIILNYQGAGADSTTQSAFVFNNEMYLTATENGNTSNNIVLFYDRKHAFYRWTPSVSTFARMNQTLYAGSSTNGNVYKMRNGYSYNGTAYTMTAVTKEDMLGSLELNKGIYKIYVLYRVQNSGSFTFSYRTDNYKSASGSAWKDTVVDQTKGGIAEIAVNTENISSLQMKITQASSVNVQIVGMIVMFGYLNVR